jgi:hypothetical protein
MNITKTIEQFNSDNIFLCDPIKNNIMNDGYFIRIMYSTDKILLNGVYIAITINDYTCEKYYDKYRCIFNTNTNRDMIDKLKIIEESIIHKMNLSPKIPQLKINEQLQNGNIKIFNDVSKKHSNTFILKISGIWETAYNYGLTYKFIKTTD